MGQSDIDNKEIVELKENIKELQEKIEELEKMEVRLYRFKKDFENQLLTLRKADLILLERLEELQKNIL
jgi:hypothetical protein|tara:strand:+ start:143 stop:349 length:207 start_codon:yes stop_codon:yes gene_type:complete